MSKHAERGQRSTPLHHAPEDLKMTTKGILRSRYKPLFKAMKRDFEDFVKNGTIESAAKYGDIFMKDCWPQYFTGDLDAEIVMVHLNPAYNKDRDHVAKNRKRFTNFDEYIENSVHCIKPQDSTIKYNAKFDQNMVKFVRGFKELDILIDNKSNKISNLIAVCDRKLQLELVPYGSRRWNTKKAGPYVLQDNLERLLDVITAIERKYVLFCGGIFENILNVNLPGCEVVAYHPHSKPLAKVGGGKAAYRARIINIQLLYKGKSVSALILPTYPMHGLNYVAYGQYCKSHAV